LLQPYFLFGKKESNKEKPYRFAATAQISVLHVFPSQRFAKKRRRLPQGRLSKAAFKKQVGHALESARYALCFQR
jgi:hypothetical protein